MMNEPPAVSPARAREGAAVAGAMAEARAARAAFVLTPELKAAAARVSAALPDPPLELLIPLRPVAAAAFARLAQQAEAEREAAARR
jgi:hypothetical protein